MFADHGKQTSVFLFRLQKTKGSLPFLFTVWSKHTEVAFSVPSIFRSFRLPYIYMYIYMYLYLYKYLYIYNYMSISIYICCHFKRTMEAQAIFLNPFTICSSCKRKFVICHLFLRKQTEVIHLQGTNGLKRLNGLAHLRTNSLKSMKCFFPLVKSPLGHC